MRSITKMMCSLLLGILGILKLNAENLATLDGKQFIDVEVTSVDTDGIRIKHRDGVTKIRFANLPETIRQKFISNTSSPLPNEVATPVSEPAPLNAEEINLQIEKANFERLELQKKLYEIRRQYQTELSAMTKKVNAEYRIRYEQWKADYDFYREKPTFRSNPGPEPQKKDLMREGNIPWLQSQREKLEKKMQEQDNLITRLQKRALTVRSQFEMAQSPSSEREDKQKELEAMQTAAEAARQEKARLEAAKIEAQRQERLTKESAAMDALNRIQVRVRTALDAEDVHRAFVEVEGIVNNPPDLVTEAFRQGLSTLALEIFYVAQKTDDLALGSAALQLAIFQWANNPEITALLFQSLAKMKTQIHSYQYKSALRSMEFIQGMVEYKNMGPKFRSELSNACLDNGWNSLWKLQIFRLYHSIEAAKDFWSDNPRLLWIQVMAGAVLVAVACVIGWLVLRFMEKYYWRSAY